METLFDVMMEVFDRSMQVLGPILLVGGSALVCVVGFLFFSTPFVSTETHSMATVLALDTLGAWLWFNILFNWFMCWKTDPGGPPKDPPKPQAHNSVCQKCDSFKPSRAHHCHVCRRCILAMDHHCPWMANCIGYFNYRYFVLTLFYLTIGCIFCVAVITLEFEVGIRAFLNQNAFGIPKHVFFVFFLCICAGSAVGLLLAWHIYLILSGQTTIEFYQRRSTPASRRRSIASRSWYKVPFFQPPIENNDYDLGARQNWDRVFGSSRFPMDWTMPSLKPPPGDGVEWKTCRSLVDLVA